jgi:hypothetical protein
MKIERSVTTGLIALSLISAVPGICAPNPNTTSAPAQLVITVRPSAGGTPLSLTAGDVRVLQGDTPATVVSIQRLADTLADMQLFVLMDDSTRSASLGTQLPELKTFIASLPATAQVAAGYMRNGAVAVAQPFTLDHQKVVHAMRLPMAMPGENGSPYFALSDLAKHWPSKEPTARRAVLMLTDGVDRYYTEATDDPYVETAIRDALKDGVMVYSIYLRGAGVYGRGTWPTTIAQSRLMQVSEETGGYTYFQGFTDPVSIAPFLKDFLDRLDNQYQVTLQALNGKGVQPIKLRTELPGLKIEGPSRVYVR